jgi:hypothetical protein
LVQGHHTAALRLYDAIVAAAPLDFDARIRVADAALTPRDAGAARVYRAVGAACWTRWCCGGCRRAHW